MKTLRKLAARCLLAAVGVALALVVVSLSVLVGVGLHEAKNYPYSRHQVGEVAQALRRTGSGFALDAAHTPEEWLDGYEWAMQLDEQGCVIWQSGLPDELNRAYTVGEVAGFSRWYLDGYPVFVWRNDYGLMVLAKAKGSIWRYSFYSTPDAVRVAVRSAVQAAAFVLAAALLVCGLLLWRFWRSLRSIGQGLDALAQGQPVTVQAEGMLAELARTLDRTGELLRRQNEALARRDAARTNWVAGVSHDIRTPLALIVGYAERLQPDETAEKIQTQAQKIKSLVEDLNLTSKLQYNAQPLRLAEVQAGALLRQAAADFCNSELPPNTRLVFSLGEDAGQALLRADASLLARALDNLLQNASRHNAGGCTVTLAANCTGGHLVITVSDDGAGYPPAVLTALQTGVTGENTPPILGLHLVEQIAAAHGGQTAFSQNQPHGARAVLTLPLA